MFVLYEGGFNGSSPEIQPLSQFVGCLLLFIGITELPFDVVLKVPPADVTNTVVIGTFVFPLPV